MYGGRSGIGEYLAQMMARLPKHLPRASWTVFGDPPRSVLPPNSRLVRVRSRIYSVSEQVSIPVAALGKDLSVYFSPHYNAPLLVPAPLVVTVHDLIHLLFPEYLPSPRVAARAYAWFMLKAVCRRARKVLTISENTARDLARMLKVPRMKIKVVPLGVDEVYSPVRSPGALGEFRRKMGLSRGYLLYVGNLKPHKNVEALVRVFALLNRPGLKLVLSGREDPDYRGVRLAVRAGGLENRVVFIANTSRQQRRLLYAGADLFVFPSLYEGFGLPPLEAMACGTPVVASNASSIPEVTGDAAILVNPRDDGALLRAIKAVMERRSLRALLSRKGLARARPFSWDCTASRTAEILAAASHQGGSERGYC